MKDGIQFRQWQWIVCFCILSGLASFIGPPPLLAGPPNVVLSRAIHFTTMDGNPVTLSPGKYLVEQAGPTELRVTAVADNKEFLIQAEALSHEQYELFSPMALTRPSRNQEVLIALYLPGGVRLEARGSSKELPKPTPVPELPKIPQTAELPAPPSEPIPPNETPYVAAITPDPEPPAFPQTTPIPDSATSAPAIFEELPVITYQAPAPDKLGLRISQ